MNIHESVQEINSVEIRPVLKQLIEILDANPLILSARLYGSRFTQIPNTNRGADLDLAVMIPSIKGVVAAATYYDLRGLRRELCQGSGVPDIDLVPHTLDEVNDPNSPLFNPRYYPSLRFGVDIKREFPVPEKISFTQDAAAYILHDNRTITRRQLLRDCSPENWRIFLAKLRHSPGNALTYKALHEDVPCFVDPSDTGRSFNYFDRIFKTNSEGIITLFTQVEEQLSGHVPPSFEQAVRLLRWYEALVSTVLDYNPNALNDFFQEEEVHCLPVSVIPIKFSSTP